MASYRLTDAALADLERIYEYGILNFGLSQADKYYDGLVLQIRLHFQKIADSPLSHPSVELIRSTYRRATYFTNSIYYRIDSEGVEIIRVLGRQDPEKQL